MGMDRELESRARRAGSHWGIYGPDAHWPVTVPKPATEALPDPTGKTRKDRLACAASQVLGPHSALRRLSTRHIGTLDRRADPASRCSRSTATLSRPHSWDG